MMKTFSAKPADVERKWYLIDAVMDRGSAGAPMPDLELRVECGDEPAGGLPRRFGRAGRMREVAEILDRWDGDDHRYFRVRDEDGGTWLLRQDLRDGSWRLHAYRRDDVC